MVQLYTTQTMPHFHGSHTGEICPKNADFNRSYRQPQYIILIKVYQSNIPLILPKLTTQRLRTAGFTEPNCLF